MLLKLLKWELRATYKKFGLVLIVFAAVCIALPLILLAASPQAAFIATMLILMLGIGAVTVIIYIFCLQRYNSHLYRREGYLTHTLPVGSRTLLVSKLISGYVWTLATMVLIFFAGLVALQIFKANTEFWNVMAPLARVYKSFLSADVLSSLAVYSLISIADGLLVLYFAITFAKLPVWGRGGTGMGFLAYFGTYILQSLPSFIKSGELTRVTLEAQGTADSANAAIAASKMTADSLANYYSWHSLWPQMLLYAAISVVIFEVTALLLRKATALK